MSLLSTLYIVLSCLGYFLLVGWSTRNIGRQIQSSDTTKRKLEVHLLTVVRYSFPQSGSIHTQIALKMKYEYFLTKFCEKPTVYMP